MLQSVHQLLPPPYRAVWLEWLDVENAAKQEAKEKENKVMLQANQDWHIDMVLKQGKIV